MTKETKRAFRPIPRVPAIECVLKPEAARRKAIPPAGAPNEKYLRSSIRAYFEGEPGCDLRWISEIVRAAPVHARSILETGFSQYVSTEKYRDLLDRL
jgi:hypothetical protein